MNRNRCVGVCLAALVSGALAAFPTSAAQPPSAAAAERLAATLGVKAGRLSDVRVTVETLLDGRQLETVKAMDLETGGPVGATFEGERRVDRYVEVSRAGMAWRERHGAITPGLAQRLETLAPGERTPVSAWLAVDLSSLPAEKPVLRRRGGEQDSGAARNLPAAASAASAPSQAAPALGAVKRATPGQPSVEAAREQERVEQQAILAAADCARQAAVRELIAPVREAFLDRAASLDLAISYAGEISPLVVLEADRQVLEELASWPEVDALYDATGEGRPSLAYARPTQDVTPVNDVGYDGSGVTVAVTEPTGRVCDFNPYLTVAGTFDNSRPIADHATAVAGVIRSSDGLAHGLAGDVTLYSANGHPTEAGVMAQAMDWGSLWARVLNNSWYWEFADNNAAFNEWDRHQDFFVHEYFDTVVVAAGNFGNGCTQGGFWSNFVVSPAKGHNILTVGNYDDFDTLAWGDDAMEPCSSFGNPLNSAGTGNQEKPEIAAVGTGIATTITSDPWIGSGWWGTSFAAPMVSALAADIMEAEPGIEDDPEAVKAVLMATALHNIEGGSVLSDQDGAGGMVGTAAAVSVERGNWSSQPISQMTAFPIEYTQFAYQGETVRFAIAWSAAADATYTTDPLQYDLDLTAYRADGVTLVAWSASPFNAYEIVEFTAPASETYVFRASLYSIAWDALPTWLGAGWWRGEYRIPPDVGFTEPAAKPTGTHFAVYPSDWPSAYYWRAMAVRPAGTATNHGLELASSSLFDDPWWRVVEKESYAWGSNLIVVDGNHRTTTPEHYRVRTFVGADGYDATFSNPNLGAADEAGPVTLGPITLSPAQVISVVDVAVPAGSHRLVQVVPTAGGSDLALWGFRSENDVTSSWVKNKDEADLYRNRSASGTATEQGALYNPSAADDFLGVVVEKLGVEEVTFEIVVQPSSLFSEGFEGGDLLEWSNVVP